MGYYNKNWIDDTAMEFPRWAFWLIHIIVPVLIFTWGMRFAIHRVPIPLMGYRLIRKFTKR